MNQNREYRMMEMRIQKPEAEEAEKSYMVEGYASTFERYKLLTIDNEDYYEHKEKAYFRLLR